VNNAAASSLGLRSPGADRQLQGHDEAWHDRTNSSVERHIRPLEAQD
jgi:hypothetical protein